MTHDSLAELDDYTDDELYMLTPFCILHEAAREAPDHAVAHAVPLSDGTDSLLVAMHFTDKEKARRVFDFLHEVSEGLVMDWEQQQNRRAEVKAMLQQGTRRVSA